MNLPMTEMPNQTTAQVDKYPPAAPPEPANTNNPANWLVDRFSQKFSRAESRFFRQELTTSALAL
jgi:hypothetical protein